MGCINYMMPSNDEKQTATTCYDNAMPIYHFVSNQAPCWHFGCLVFSWAWKHGDREVQLLGGESVVVPCVQVVMK